MAPKRKKTEKEKEETLKRLKSGQTGNQDALNRLLSSRNENFLESDRDETSKGRKYYKQTKEEIELDEKALKEALKVSKLTGKPPRPDGRYLINGMKTPLIDYQLVGVSIMSNIEEYALGIRGGINADEMGLGKTLQALGLILTQCPKPTDTKNNWPATLIVVPSTNHVNQWMAEIKAHVNLSDVGLVKSAGLKFEGPKSIREPLKFDPKLPMVAYEKSDIILATYSQIERVLRKPGSDLARFNFHRVILDEAAKIKGWSSQTSKACAALNAKRRWAITATPVPNGLIEIKSYVRFLGANLRTTRAEFEKLYGPLSENTEMERHLQFLGRHMVRREMGSLFRGKAICELPKSHHEKIYCRMGDTEQWLYRFMEQFTGQKFKDAAELDTAQMEVKDATPMATISLFQMAIVLTQRLRMIADNPLLLDHFVNDQISSDDLQILTQDLDNSNTGEQEDQELAAWKENLEFAEKAKAFNVCTQCMRDTEDDLECGHYLCVICYKNLAVEAKENGKAEAKCPECRKNVIFVEEEENDEDDECDPWPEVCATAANGKKLKTARLGRPKKKKPGDDYNETQPKMKGSSTRWLRLSETSLGTNHLKSAKISKTMEYIRKWQKEAPDDKIIVFGEWKLTALVLGRLLEKEKIGFVYFWGDLTKVAQGKALQTFQENPKVKVMLAGLRCGSEGLNMTCANRVIYITPWWHACAVQQAFGRVRRIGQTKETYLVELFLKDSIDERIFKLQQKKKNEFDGAMREGKKPKLQRDDYLELLCGFGDLAAADNNNADASDSIEKTEEDEDIKAEMDGIKEESDEVMEESDSEVSFTGFGSP